uniref:Uncharacterized protein n=1 Tax=Anguilla anguilla TaxID=7936 RepID=A0A0E9SZ72_ANGAN
MNCQSGRIIRWTIRTVAIPVKRLAQTVL